MNPRIKAALAKVCDIPDHMEPWFDSLGNVWAVHATNMCFSPCPIHSPTDHVMKNFPLIMRMRGSSPLMERICHHGIGHPDPDHLSFYKEKYGEESAYYESIHGCDGCCKEN